jgi:antitoxin HicB
MRVLNYRILLRQENEGGYTVLVPSLPGCVTYGDTIDEAFKMAREAIELYIDKTG